MYDLTAGYKTQTEMTINYGGESKGLMTIKEMMNFSSSVVKAVVVQEKDLEYLLGYLTVLGIHHIVSTRSNAVIYTEMFHVIKLTKQPYPECIRSPYSFEPKDNTLFVMLVKNDTEVLCDCEHY